MLKDNSVFWQALSKKYAALFIRIKRHKNTIFFDVLLKSVHQVLQLVQLLVRHQLVYQLILRF